MVRTLLIGCLLLFSVNFTSAQSWLDYYDSTYLYWDKDWNKSIELLQTALPLAEKDIGSAHPNYAVLLNDLGLCYWQIGDFKQGITTLEKSLRIKRVSLGENDPDYKASLLNLASILHDNNQIKAESLYLNIIESYNQSNFKDAFYITALNSLGNLYETQANYSQAEKFYLLVLSHKEETAGVSHPTYAKVLLNLGNLYKKAGNIKKAEDHFLQAKAVYEEGAVNTMDYATFLSDYGLFQADKGDFGVAEKYLNQSEKIIIDLKGGKSKEYASSLNNLGSLHWRMGETVEVESYFKEALLLYEQIYSAESPELAPALNNLAGFYVNSRQFDKALPLYFKAQRLYASQFGKMHPLYANSLNNLASLYRKTKDYGKAEILYKEVLNIEKEVLGENHPQYASSLQNMGMLAIATGNYTNAENLLKKAISIKKDILEPQHPSWADTYNNLALLYLLQKKSTEASPLFEEALTNQFNQIKNVFPALSEKEKEAFYNTLKDDIERFNTFALSQYSTDSSMAGVMYNNQLITKGLLFDASTKIRERVFGSNSEQLIAKYNQWRALREEIAHSYQLSKAVITQRGIDVEGLTNQANQLEKELSSQSFELNPQGNWQELSWKDIRDKLLPGEAAIEIIRFRDFAIMPQSEKINDTTDQMVTNLLYGWTEKINYAALIVTHQTQDHPELVLLEEGEALENKYYAYYANGIRYKVQDSFSYQRYWGEIQREISGIETVYFSPDGAFHKINVNTLYDSLSSNYLLSNILVKQVTSTRDLLFSKNSKEERKHAILIGDPAFNFSLGSENIENEVRDSELNFVASIRENETGPDNPFILPLPGTKTEVNKIYEILIDSKWSAQKLLNEAALEENIKKINNPAVLHIATHGYFNEEGEVGIFKSKDENNPLLNSGLLLSGAQNSLGENSGKARIDFQNEDGILTAFEAMNLKLDQTDLVVLSACETGSGTIKNGEGVYGLQRAFQVAGASNIIFSLWKVDDKATQKLMTYFYKHWMASNSKREAFSIAQQELKKDYPEPYYWGAFILIGD